MALQWDEGRHLRSHGKFAPGSGGQPQPAPRQRAAAPAPDSRAAAAEERVVRDQGARAVERGIVDRETEQAVVLDRNGKKLFATEGDEVSASLTMNQLRAARDGVVTHNHPQGTSLSLIDVKTASVANLAELRAVGRPQVGEMAGMAVVYRMVRPARGWPPVAAIDAAFGRHDAALFAELKPLVLNGRLSGEEARGEYNHRLWTALAKDFGIQYERIPLGSD